MAAKRKVSVRRQIEDLGHGCRNLGVLIAQEEKNPEKSEMLLSELKRLDEQWRITISNLVIGEG